MVALIAQGPPPPIIPLDPPAASPATAPGGWLLLASSAVATVGAVASTWINSNAGAEKRRADVAETEVREMVGRFERLDEERKALAMERDLWMQRAYSHGYRPGEDAPAPARAGDRP
jgi:hypothetical protein